MLFVVGPCFETPDATSKLQAFQATKLHLQAYLQPKHYGEALQEFFLGILCVSPEYRMFAKPRRDRYTKDRKVQYRDGFEIVRERTFECEVELPYELVLTASPEEVVRLMSQGVMLAVDRLSKQLPKLGTFDLSSFKQDVTDCLLANKSARVESVEHINGLFNERKSVNEKGWSFLHQKKQ